MQWLLLDISKRYSSSLADDLHENRQGPRPYTVSGLMHLNSTEPVLGYIEKGDRSWFRITALSPEILHVLDAYVRRVADINPISEAIDDKVASNWSVEAFHCDMAQHEWAGRINTANLHQHAFSQYISLYFASPTGFHQNGHTVPLPVPTLVVGSLVSKWRSFSKQNIPSDLLEFVRYMLVISDLSIVTEKLKFKNGSVQKGFQGHVTYHLLKNNSDLENRNPHLHDRFLKDYEIYAGCLQTLFKFAFYSGVGIKATQGMGMMVVR